MVLLILLIMKKVIKFICATVVRQLISIAVMLIFGAILFSIFAGLSSPVPTAIKKGSFLVIDLNVQVYDAPKEMKPDEILEDMLLGKSERRLYLYELLEAIQNASQDDRIKGVFITGNFAEAGAGNGMAVVTEFLDGLQRFKSSGKKLIGYTENPTQKDYLVYSLCDKIYLNPFGGILLNGMASQALYMGDALENWGIQVQAPRSGKYKSAIEPFTRGDMSDENRQQLKELLKSRWSILLQRYAANREINVEKLYTMVMVDPYFKPEQAREMGLVDEIAYFDEVLDALIEEGVLNEDMQTFEQVSLMEYVESISPKTIPVNNEKEKIAIVYVEGAIVDQEEGLSPDMVSGKVVACELRMIRKKNKAKGVVLRVNSPGGSAFASEEILRELKLVREAGIPVVVSMGSMAASGGYWIAMESNHIFADPSTITGSIGVFGMIPNIEKLSEKLHLNWETVKTHPFADIFTITREKTPEEMDKIQELIDEIYGKFLDRVAKGRDLSREAVDELAQGRVWSGVDAKNNGLVDSHGGLLVAIKHCSELAHLENWQIEHYPKKKTGIEVLEEILSGESVKMEYLDLLPSNKITDTVRKQFEFLNILQDPHGLYALFPYIIE